MKRTLYRNRQKERADQQRLQERISAAAEKRMRREIDRASKAILQKYEASGQVALPDDHVKEVATIIRLMRTAAIKTFSQRTSETIKHTMPGVIKAEGEPLFERIIQAYLLSVGGDRIADDIALTTKKQIARIVASASRDGLGQAATAKRIRATIPILSRSRSALIARTETHAAAMYSTVETAAESNLVLQKEWIASSDDRTRDGEFDHVDADGQVVPQGEAFMVSGEPLMYPGDMSGSAGNTINCRCGMGWVVID